MRRRTSLGCLRPFTVVVLWSVWGHIPDHTRERRGVRPASRTRLGCQYEKQRDPSTMRTTSLAWAGETRPTPHLRPRGRGPDSQDRAYASF